MTGFGVPYPMHVRDNSLSSTTVTILPSGKNFIDAGTVETVSTHSFNTGSFLLFQLFIERKMS